MVGRRRRKGFVLAHVAALAAAVGFTILASGTPQAQRADPAPVVAGAGTMAAQGTETAAAVPKSVRVVLAAPF